MVGRQRLIREGTARRRGLAGKRRRWKWNAWQARGLHTRRPVGRRLRRLPATIGSPNPPLRVALDDPLALLRVPLPCLATFYSSLALCAELLVLVVLRLVARVVTCTSIVG